MTSSAIISQDAIDKAESKNVDESDVGILCYISQLPGFRGILKQRYSDFIVNEVDLNGNVVHLTSLDVPPELVEKKEMAVEQSDKTFTEEIESFRSLVGDTDADCLKELIEKVKAGADQDISPLVLSPSSDKAHRTAVHNFFKEKLKFLVTDTIDGPQDSSKCIRVWHKSAGNQKRRNCRKRKDRFDKPFDKRDSHDWGDHLGKFLRFHLYKENKDTQEALRLIGQMLGVQPRSFGFAGTKDKRAVSTQQVTIFKQHAGRLASLNAKLFGIRLGDFCYVKEGLQLGQLFGNRFTITLRGVSTEFEDTIRASADALGKCGFVNYFGLQRFGSGAVPTHFIGAALLRGEWKAAVDMILDPREGEREDVRKIRKDYKENNDVDRALRQLPRHMVAERAVLACLQKCPGNYVQALKAIPRTMRMMYVHSYQSYLWNHAASIRVQKYGAQGLVVGDLVHSKEDSGEIISLQTEYEDFVSNEADNSTNLEDTEVDFLDQKTFSVKAVDEEDLLRQKYTIDDVVLPLPGSKALYPANDVADVYHEVARKDNISLTESVHSVKEFSITSMSGAYRRVFQKPIDFEWEILKYKNANSPLADTDLDILVKSKSGDKIQVEKGNDSSLQSANLTNSSIICEEEPVNTMTDCANEISDSGSDVLTNSESRDRIQVEKGNDSTLDSEAQLTALKLSFTLPSSCYATMAIRELLKTSTSVAFHKTLNNQV
ncbi:unnamed protein product [Amaranthus hypochondriacus]